MTIKRKAPSSTTLKLP